jgi:hypothetical protein
MREIIGRILKSTRIGSMADITERENSAAGTNSERSPKLIGALAAREDYPQCALGEWVDIGGVEGEIFDIVGNSLKLRTSEGVARSFNYHTLKKLYGPVVHIGPTPRYQEEEPPPASAPVSYEIPDPNFDQEVRSVNEFMAVPDFPKTTLGKLIEVNGYVGVVVEIQGQSMKLRSRNGTSRKYNGAVLRKLQAKPSA